MSRDLIVGAVALLLGFVMGRDWRSVPREDESGDSLRGSAETLARRGRFREKERSWPN